WLEDVLTNKDFDLTIVSHVEPFDIGIYADPNYYFGYDNPQVQALNEQLNASIDDGERKALAQQIEPGIAKDALNGHDFELAQAGVWSARLEGMWQNAPIEGVVLREIHWVQQNRRHDLAGVQSAARPPGGRFLTFLLHRR